MRDDDLYRVIVRNSRTPESFAGDLDSEVAARRMGARRLQRLFERYGIEMIEACFDALIERCAETFRREILPRIPNGTYEFEDYIEHDGVDEPRLHVLHLTMTKNDHGIVCDLTGTGPEAKGPMSHAGDDAGGLFLRKWMACILRNLAGSPERAAELDINEGICELIQLRFPPKGTLVTPEFPAPTNARSFPDPAPARSLRRLPGAGRRRPHARRSGDRPLLGRARHRRRRALVPPARGPRWGCGRTLVRRRLGRDSHRSRLQETARRVRRDPLPHPRRAAGAGDRLGRSRQAPWRAGLRQGDSTTGRGWGDPFEREADLVLEDVLRGLVSAESAERDYGVVVREERVAELRRQPRERPFFDRGPGYEAMRLGGT